MNNKTFVSANNVLGVDIGNVIMDYTKYVDTELSFHGENYLKTPTISGAFDALRELNSKEFRNNIFLISKVSKVPETMFEWLETNNFYKHTGIDKSQVFLCETDDEKIPVCEKLNLTHYVDDKIEILNNLIGKIKYLYLYDPKNENKNISPEIKVVSDWSELAEVLRNDL